MELQKGRPKYTEGRLEKEIRTYDLLDKLGVAYERVDHEAAMTMEVCQEIDEVLQATICKNPVSYTHLITVIVTVLRKKSK